jgi:hypothetical protein
VSSGAALCLSSLVWAGEVSDVYTAVVYKPYQPRVHHDGVARVRPKFSVLIGGSAETHAHNQVSEPSDLPHLCPHEPPSHPHSEAHSPNPSPSSCATLLGSLYELASRGRPLCLSCSQLASCALRSLPTTALPKRWKYRVSWICGKDARPRGGGLESGREG